MLTAQSKSADKFYATVRWARCALLRQSSVARIGVGPLPFGDYNPVGFVQVWRDLGELPIDTNIIPEAELLAGAGHAQPCHRPDHYAGHHGHRGLGRLRGGQRVVRVRVGSRLALTCHLPCRPRNSINTGDRATVSVRRSQERWRHGHRGARG